MRDTNTNKTRHGRRIPNMMKKGSTRTTKGGTGTNAVNTPSKPTSTARGRQREIRGDDQRAMTKRAENNGVRWLSDGTMGGGLQMTT